MDALETQNMFVNNFINKTNRDRTLFELNSSRKREAFLIKLNHQSLNYIEERKLILIPKKESNEYLFIRENLKVKGTDLCLILSNYNHIDNKIMPFKEAFDEIYGNGLASLLVFEKAEKIYLQTEQEQGASDKYIGKI